MEKVKILLACSLCGRKERGSGREEKGREGNEEGPKGRPMIPEVGM